MSKVIVGRRHCQRLRQVSTTVVKKRLAGTPVNKYFQLVPGKTRDVRNILNFNLYLTGRRENALISIVIKIILFCYGRNGKKRIENHFLFWGSVTHIQAREVSSTTRWAGTIIIFPQEGPVTW